MDEYLNVLCRRLQLVRFVSGESNLKVDAIHRLTGIVGIRGCYDTSILLKICELMRVFMIDWDRTVRSCAFRCLRYCINLPDPIVDDELRRLYIHQITVMRLEACKSSTERASILKFITSWVKKTSDGRTVSLFVTSMVELIVAAAGSAQGDTLSAFVGVIFEILFDGVHRFPKEFIHIIHRNLDQLASVANVDWRSRIIELCTLLCIENQVVLFPSLLISAASFSEKLPLGFTRRFVPEVPEVPQPPHEVIDSEDLADVVKEVDALASSVHFKQKSTSLTNKKQRTPQIFQSVHLWFAIMQRMEIGRFSLQARRTIHALFIHVLCDEQSLEVLDSLSC